MSFTQSDIAAAPVVAGFDALLGALPDATKLSQLATRIAASVSELPPSSRLLIAERLVAYTCDLLVRPLSPAGGRVLDEAGTKLRSLGKRSLPACANDR